MLNCSTGIKRKHLSLNRKLILGILKRLRQEIKNILVSIKLLDDYLNLFYYLVKLNEYEIEWNEWIKMNWMKWMNKNLLYTVVPMEIMILTKLTNSSCEKKYDVLNYANMTDWLMTCYISLWRKFYSGANPTRLANFPRKKTNPFICFTLLHDLAL